jgi:indole-3-glycerol phosphate synthase
MGMDKLQEIMAWKRQEVAGRVRPIRDSELAQYCKGEHPHRFENALRRKEGLAIISEIKRRSPSAGAIAEERDSTEQARLYYNAGADAISVLTDEKYFGGSIQDLWNVNDLLGNRKDAPPTLRKDFFVDRLQVLEAAEAGASCILIIVRALSDEEMDTLFDAANLAGLDAIFEVHEEKEVDRALNCGARIVGVNNRDLTRFVTDLAISEKIIPQLPESCIAISESGIHSIEDAERAFACGSNAILVGEALMKMKDPEPFIKEIHDF